MTRPTAVLLALGVTAFAGLTSAVGMASGAPLEFLVADAVIGTTFIVGGLGAAWLRPASPAGPMLLASGALWFVGSYAPTGQPVVMWLGFAFERYYDLTLAALLLLLSAPDHVLRPRSLAWALGAGMGLRSAGRLLLQDPARLYPEAGLPPNPFALWPDLVVFERIEVASNVAVAVLLLAIGVIALARLMTGGPVARRIRWPIILAGGAAMAGGSFDALEYAWSTATGSLLFEPEEPLATIIGWLGFAARSLMPLGFLAGTLRLRSMAGPLAPFAAEAGRPGGPEGLRAALRTALGDASLELLRPTADGRWVTESGTDAGLPEPGSRRGVTFVGRGDPPLAAIVHDPALADHPELLNSVGTVLRLALENERLEAEVREQLQAVSDSRARIVVAVEEERRRIERDLHDGAQQQLVAVMLRLSVARAEAGDQAVPVELRRSLNGIAEELAQATHELRELARGIHPAILTEEGLGPAITSLARRASFPVDVHLELAAQLPAPVESTVYFTVAEALTNAQRYADASRATVEVSHRDGELVVEVADDGRGGADPARGSGLRGLADRVAALGGVLTVGSEPGRGSRVRATIPVG